MSEGLKVLRIEFSEPTTVKLEIKDLMPVSELIKQGVLKGGNRLVLLPPLPGSD